MPNYNSNAAAYAPSHGGYPGEVQEPEANFFFASEEDLS